MLISAFRLFGKMFRRTFETSNNETLTFNTDTMPDNIIRVGDKVARSYYMPETFEKVVLEEEYTVTRIEEFEGFYGPSTLYHTEGSIVLSDMTCTKVQPTNPLTK